MSYLILYLTVINAAGFLIMLADKYRAKRGLWRIPEKTLFLTALLGGSAGCIIGMQVFRHKTKHLTFTIGMPAILVLQITAAIFLYSRFYA